MFLLKALVAIVMFGCSWQHTKEVEKKNTPVSLLHYKWEKKPQERNKNRKRTGNKKKKLLL